MSEERELPPTGNTPSELRDLIAETFREQTTERPAGDDRAGIDQPANAGQPPREGEPPSGAAPVGETAGGSSTGDRPPAAAADAPSPGSGDRAGADQTGGTGAPQHWAAADKSTFEALPEPAKAPFLDLYKRMERGFQPRLEKLAALEKDLPAMQERVGVYDRDYTDIDRLFAPHRERLRGEGRGPKEILQVWYNTEVGLADPATRDQTIANLIAGYQADPFKIAEHLNARRGFAPTAGGDAQPQRQLPSNNGYVPHPDGYDQYLPSPNGGRTQLDPALEARFRALEGAERGRAEAQFRSEVENARRVYQEFADARNSAGELLHPLFSEVENRMAELLKIEKEAGRSFNLQSLYDEAAWSLPSTRERLLEQRGDAEARKAADERKTRSEAARRAGSSVTGSPGPGAAPQDLAGSDRSIRDEIRAQLAGDRR
jgi:hypothetical protein